MAIFESNIVQTTTITSAALVWDPSNSSTTAFGPQGKVPVLTPVAQTLKDVTVINQGPGILYLGGSTVTTATGLPVPVGAQVTIRGYVGTAGSSAAAGRVYGISASTSNVEAGLETVDATV